jgi:hypothetical protein
MEKLLFVILLTRASVWALAGKKGDDSKKSDDSWMNFEDAFLYGKDAYLGNDWKKCVYYMEKAIDDYRFYTDHVTKYESSSLHLDKAVHV